MILRQIGFGCLGGIGVLLAGCYTLQPVRGATPVVGTVVAFDVNDAGRVALGGSVGPEIAQIEGRLIERDSAGYLLAISTIRLLRGGEQTWTGEQVRVRPEHVGNAYEKRFSMGRSVALGAVAAGGITAVVVARSLIASGSDPDDGPCCDTVQTRRVRP